MLSNGFTPQKPKELHCNKCDFNTSNKKDFNRHLLTEKHKINENQCFSMVTHQ